MRNDQAQGLRQLFVQGAVPTCAIGGAGNDAAVLAIARAFAAQGERVLLLDRSRGGIAGCAGKRARHELWHVLDGDVPIANALIPLGERLTLLPAARGLDLLAADPRDWRDVVAATIGAREAPFDLWLVHGMPPSAQGCDEPFFIVAPTRVSVTRVYAQIKALVTAQGRRNFGVLVAESGDPAAAGAVFKGLAATAKRFLGVNLEFCGGLARNGVTSADDLPPVAKLRERIAASFAVRSQPPMILAA